MTDNSVKNYFTISTPQKALEYIRRPEAVIKPMSQIDLRLMLFTLADDRAATKHILYLAPSPRSTSQVSNKNDMSHDQKLLPYLVSFHACQQQPEGYHHFEARGDGGGMELSLGILGTLGKVSTDRYLVRCSNGMVSRDIYTYIAIFR